MGPAHLARTSEGRYQMLQLDRPTMTNAVIVLAPGDLRFGRSEALWKTETDELLERGGRVVALDLSAVESVDAAGIGALLETRHRVEKSGGTLVLLRPTERLRRLLDLCALTAQFQVQSDDPPDDDVAAAEGNRVSRLLALVALT